ncbi:MAG: efflux RND transporter periplasmic adaptor subunit [Alphaproteobacteria bacterium]
MNTEEAPEKATQKRRRPSASMLLAIVLAIAAIGWIASGNLEMLGLADPVETAGQPVAETAETEKPDDAPPQAVRVFDSVARERQTNLVIAGRTEASRRVVIRAETAGTIREIDVFEGEVVEKGQVLARLSIEDRQAKYDEAKALVAQREIEYDAASKLANKGFQSEIRRAEALAELDAAKAQRQQWRVELDRTAIRAPFSGIYHSQQVELGDYVEQGNTIGTVTDLDPILVVGDVSEREVSRIGLGETASAKLITGQEEQGKIVYIGSVANETTRTYRVEVEITQTGNAFREGMTAELRLPTVRAKAHLISPGFLTLSDTGAVGLKTVDGDNVVHFHLVQILESSPQGMWVGGLPDEATLITVGQEYVIEGETVTPVPDTVLAPRFQSGGEEGNRS